MFNNLPKATTDIQDWTWDQFQVYYDDLNARTLSAENVEAWLKDWSDLAMTIGETYNRLYVAVTQDTTDEEMNSRFQKFVDAFVPAARAADQKLKVKLLTSGLEPPGFEIPLRNIGAEVDLFREENLPLLTREIKLNQEYDRIIGAQTVNWNGQELTIAQLLPVYQDPDRSVRERAWRLAAGRQLQDKEALNELWGKLLATRLEIAANAGKPSYIEYRWQDFKRFDYSPEDCHRFHDAIEKVVVPAVKKILEERRNVLGVESLRPWDLEVDTTGKPPLRPFQTADELTTKAASIFRRVDPQFGDYFDILEKESLLDLENRKGKAPGGYCIDFIQAQRPFIFMNAVGIHDDVMTILHETGHAFHVFESARLPYFHQMQYGAEIAEVASMSMELLATPYLSETGGGFYSRGDTARARREHLEGILRFWPYMSVVDAFQLWVYENPQAASDPGSCDAKWTELWNRFMVGIDTSGLEDWTAAGWQRKLHIFQDPFYYVEYGIAQLGAIQVWRNALQDQGKAVAAYRKALSLGGSRPLPELFAAAGANFAFDEPVLREAVDLILSTLEQLREQEGV